MPVSQGPMTSWVHGCPPSLSSGVSVKSTAKFSVLEVVMPGKISASSATGAGSTSSVHVVHAATISHSAPKQGKRKNTPNGADSKDSKSATASEAQEAPSKKARLSVVGEAGAAAGFGSSIARQTPEQPTPLTSAVGTTAQPVNPPGVRKVECAHLTQSAPRLPGFTACDGGSSNGTFCNRAAARNAMTRMSGSRFMDNEEDVGDTPDCIDVDAATTSVPTITKVEVVDCSDSSAGSGHETSSGRSSPDTASSTVPHVQAVRKGRGRKPGMKRPIGSYEAWTLKHLKAAGRHRGIRRVYRFGKNDREQIAKLLERQDEEKGRQSPFVGDMEKWIEERGDEVCARTSATRASGATSAAPAPNAQDAYPPENKLPEGVVAAYESAIGMGATFSPERPFNFDEKAYSVRDLEAAVTANNKDVAAGSVSGSMSSRRKTKNCLPRLCNILTMEKYRHRLLLSKQPLSRADTDAKKVGSSMDLWKEVLEDYVDPEFETGGSLSDAVQLAHINPSLLGQPLISVDKLRGMWSDAVRAWNRSKTNFEDSGSNSEFWDFCGGNTDVLYLHETFVRYPDLNGFSDARMPEDMQREETGGSERTLLGRSGAEADANRRKAAKDKAVTNVATVRGTGQKNKAGKDGDHISQLASAIFSMLPLMQDSMAVDNEGLETSKRARDEERERNRQEGRMMRAEFKDLCEHLRYLRDEISNEKALDDPDEFMISCIEEEMQETKNKIKRRKTGTRVDGGGEGW